MARIRMYVALGPNLEKIPYEVLDVLMNNGRIKFLIDLKGGNTFKGGESPFPLHKPPP